jgi:hypothetical protein
MARRLRPSEPFARESNRVIPGQLTLPFRQTLRRLVRIVQASDHVEDELAAAALSSGCAAALAGDAAPSSTA